MFEVALEPLGFTYVEDRNIIRIKSQSELTTEPMDTRVFVLNYADAEEMQRLDRSADRYLLVGGQDSGRRSQQCTGDYRAPVADESDSRGD